jgi:type VI secretion system protein ImpH
MAADGGRGAADLIAALWSAPRRFELMAAVRALEAAGYDRVRFRAPLSPVFPPGDVEAVEIDPETATVETAVMALFGPNGPLPAPLAEAVRRAARDGDAGPRAFFDLFGDRLARLLVDAIRLERPSAARGDPGASPMGIALRALAGRADPAAGPAGLDRAVLAGAGLLSPRPVGLHALGRLVAAALGVPARARGLRGGWTPLDGRDRARLSRGPGGARLGTAALGGRVWLEETAIVLDVGPVGAAAFKALLPGGGRNPLLRAVAAEAAPPELDLRCRLTVSAAERPVARLGRDGARLGLSSWLAPRGAARPGTAEFVLRRAGA